MDQHKSSKSQTIRLPKDIWDELQKRAELNERSFNYIINKMIQSQIEQEARKESRAI